MTSFTRGLWNVKRKNLSFLISSFSSLRGFLRLGDARRSIFRIVTIITIMIIRILRTVICILEINFFFRFDLEGRKKKSTETKKLLDRHTPREGKARRGGEVLWILNMQFNPWKAVDPTPPVFIPLRRLPERDCSRRLSLRIL